MSHHLIDISAPSSSITCKRGQLICREDNGRERSLPMEDIGAILINSFSAQIHNRVFTTAAQCGTVIVFCENFRPVALLLPANRSTETMLTRAQVGLTDATRRALWHKTVTAKCFNQAGLAQTIAPSASQTQRLLRTAGAPRTAKESACARLYWTMLSRHLGLERFSRTRQEGGLNDLLNYGYTVLLARMLQKMLGVGIDPTFGIGHAVRERATPLAYDLMEPFRVAVDARVVAWVKGSDASALSVTKEYKQWVQGFLTIEAPHEKKRLRVELAMECVLHGFREALAAKRPALYKPWMPGNTKWDGFSWGLTCRCSPTNKENGQPVSGTSCSRTGS